MIISTARKRYLILIYMKIAVIKTGGKQYIVEPGKKLKVEKFKATNNETIKFNTLMISENDNINLGKPTLGELVEGKIIGQGKDKKISVIKYKNKTRYKRNIGHRQPYSMVEITKIGE